MHDHQRDLRAPSIHHGPLAMLAQGWLLLNCITASSIAFGFTAYAIGDWIFGQHSQSASLFGAVGVSIGILAGLGLHVLLVRWLKHRIFTLFWLTAAFIPVIGPFIGACGLIWRWQVHRRREQMDDLPEDRV